MGVARSGVLVGVVGGFQSSQLRLVTKLGSGGGGAYACTYGIFVNDDHRHHA